MKSECKICKKDSINIIYNGIIRSGKAGESTTENFSVCQCTNCNVIYLDKFIVDNSFYETKDYRNKYNNTVNRFDKKLMSNGKYETRLKKIKLVSLLDKVVIDIGCGRGLFLDLISSFTKQTIAIEPANFYREELKDLHKVYSYTNDAIKEGITGDVVMSFNVIEHVEDPLEFLREKFQILNEGGKMYMVTPNHNDILMQTIPDKFSPFYYRTAHLYYFNKKSIEYLLEKAGFSNYRVEYIHTMDISNMMMWLKKNQPTDLNKLSLFDDSFNEIYRKYLEENGMANYLWIEASR